MLAGRHGAHEALLVLARTCVLIHCAAGAGDVIQGCCQGSRHTLHPHIQKAGTPDGTAA
jgi:hypothetical protein